MYGPKMYTQFKTSLSIGFWSISLTEDTAESDVETKSPVQIFVISASLLILTRLQRNT